MNKTAIVFLTNKLIDSTIDFAIQIKRESHLDVFVVIDNNDEYHGKSFKDINFIQIPDNNCGIYHSAASIENATHLKKNPSAWDKFLMYFCNQEFYDFVWVFEDDVFISDVESIVRLDKKYNNYNKYDLVTPNNFYKKDDLMDWHWKYISERINPPYYYSMVCAMGLSKKLLTVIKDYAEEYKTLLYHEVMFNTLAMQNNLKVKDVYELKSIVWMGKWDIDEFLLLPNNFFHPRKDIENHPNLRIKISEAIKNEYIPINNLPQFIIDAI